VFNDTNHVEAHKTIRVSDTDGYSNTIGGEISVGFKIKAIEAGITAKYEHEWHHEHEFTDELTVSVPAHGLVWITVVTPNVTYKGTFTIKLGNTTWTLHDVTVSFPWPKGPPLWIVNEKTL